MPETKNYVTPKGFTKLKDELRNLLDVERPSVVKTVSWAASNGDRSENGDYIYGKRRLREIDRRIRFLTKRIESAEVIDPANQRGDRVVFGATVVVEYSDGGRKAFQLVGIDESDPAKGQLSWTSPLAKALLGKRTGDLATFQTPKGEEEIEIIEIRFQ